MADKRIIDFQTETTQLSDGDYLPLDNANNGSSKYKPYRLQTQINDINSELSGITTAESTDVGKALSPKTVSGGAVTEWQFKTISGGGGGGGVSPYTSNPSALGTASAGSSSNYSRGDHVHPMPSASDVGAASEDELIDLYPTATASGAIASFTDGADGLPVKSLTVDVEPVQSGSGDPSPDNIRPITGHTQAMVTRTGKNLLENTATTSTVNGTTFTINENKTVTVSGTPTSNAGKVINSGLFWNGSIADAKISFDAMPTGTRVFCRRVATDGTTSYPTLTASGSLLTSGYEYYDLTLQAQTTFDGSPFTVGFQLELGSTATAYEPYTADTYTIDLDGTVYGGTLDVTTGVLTVTNGYIASYNGEALPSTWISDRDVYSSGTTPTTGAQVVYALATPQTIQLTPHELTTLLGSNNIWSDAGDVEVEYRASGSLMSATDKSRLDDLYADYSSALTALGVV